jgi:DNA-binding transcriptional LysR family regulator
MNLQHLRYLLAVARTGSFTRAAGTMSVTQPTVSTGISELESQLGVQLFNRNGRRVELTLEGRTLVNYAIRIQDLVEEASDSLTKRATQGGFQFGAIDAAAIYLLPEVIHDFLAAHPDVELSVQVAPTRQLVDDLLENRSEFALITLPFKHERLRTLPLYRDRLVLVAGRAHRFAGQKAIALEDVVLEPLILFHEDSISRRAIDERFAEAGVSPRVVMAMRSPEAMRKLVEAGVGISFLPLLTVQDALETGDLVEVHVKSVRLSREIGLAWKAGRYFGPAIDTLLISVVLQFRKESAFRKLRAETRFRPH